MNSRLALIALLFAALLPSCSSTSDRAPHPGIGVLDLQQPKHGFLGISFASKRNRRDLVVRSVDGQRVRDPKLPAGLALTPGLRMITLSAQRESAVQLGRRLAGKLGAQLGQHLDASAASVHDRALTLTIISGHDYTAYMRKRGDTYQYWIEDVTDDVIVADTRL
jgi:hypothetical protein